jgi:hypothetical protein
MRHILIGNLFGIACVLFLTGCPGDLNEMCRGDGSCNYGLQCDGSFCRMPTAKANKENGEAIKRRCSFESECYCVTCAEQCGERGLKRCNFSDTTTWGNKTPAICECNYSEK